MEKWRATSDQKMTHPCRGTPIRQWFIMPTLGEVRPNLKDVTSTMRQGLVLKTTLSEIKDGTYLEVLNPWLLRISYSICSSRQMTLSNLDSISSEVFALHQPDPSSEYLRLISFSTDLSKVERCISHISLHLEQIRAQSLSLDICLIALGMMSLEASVYPCSRDVVPRNTLCPAHFSRDLTSYSHLFDQGSHSKYLKVIGLSSYLTLALWTHCALQR